jgi:2-polyprenyl-3-methyl-5-hydroxy-6-metoxy-1,4-benzoquinol methylase
MLRDWGKIMLGVRLEKTLTDRFFTVWTELLTRGLRAGDRYAIAQGQVAHRAANSLARQLLKSDCDTLAFIDSDADIDADFLNRFRDFEGGSEYDVLQAFYTRRGWPPDAIWFQRDIDGVLKKCLVLDETTEDVAIVGLHVCLIRREVFERLLGDNDPETFDWFYYPRNSLETEDAAFSMAAIAAGFRLGATTHVKAGHISNVTIGWETYQEYLHTSGEMERVWQSQELMPLICEFTGLAPQEVNNRAARGGHNVREAWELHAVDGPAATRAFYGAPDNGYLFDLYAWNTSKYYVNLTRPLRHYTGQDALVIGGGLGSEAAMLAAAGNQVTVFELPGILWDFQEARFKGNERVTLSTAEHISELWDDYFAGCYSLIVAIDVIEHVHPTEIENFLETVYSLLADGGLLYAHVNFGQQELYPMHFDHAEIFNAWVERHGLIRESDVSWRKPGERTEK